MRNLGLQFHHMGLALQEEEQAAVFLNAMGYNCQEKVYDPEQNVNLRFYTANTSPSVELVLPGEGDGPLTPILKRFNEMIYHTCYEVDDLEKCLADIEDRGLRVLPVSGPKPALLFGGRKVSFYKVMGFGLIELLEP